MKDKRITYLLFLVVAAIWGYAIYKYFFYTPEEAVVPSELEEASANSLLQSAPKLDTFTLMESYPDPFYAGGAHLRQPHPSGEAHTMPESPQPTVTAKVPPQPPKPLETTEMLAYTYCGLVQQTGTARQTGILRVHSKSYFVQPGDRVTGLTVVAIYPDSMRASTSQGTFTLKRK